MSAFVAVVPSNILRRWDRVACAQLCEAAAKLAEERDDLASHLSFAESSADLWQAMAEAERDGRQVGITQDGRVVDVPQGDSFDQAALALFALEFDAEGLRRTWDEIYARMLRIEQERAVPPNGAAK